MLIEEDMFIPGYPQGKTEFGTGFVFCDRAILICAEVNSLLLLANIIIILS